MGKVVNSIDRRILAMERLIPKCEGKIITILAVNDWGKKIDTMVELKKLHPYQSIEIGPNNDILNFVGANGAIIQIKNESGGVTYKNEYISFETRLYEQDIGPLLNSTFGCDSYQMH